MPNIPVEIKKIPDSKKLELIGENFSLGYFLNVAASRSGHNFIRENIHSWTNDFNREKRYYGNLENMVPENVAGFISDIDFSLYPHSIRIFLLRDLLNWFSAISHFLFRNLETGRRHDANLLLKNIVHAKDVLTTDPYGKDPNTVIIADNITKEEFIESIKNQIIEIPERLIDFLDRWLLMGKEWIGETNYMPEFTRIYYDDFFRSQEYRKEICNEIGGQFNENRLNFVTPMGKYSTFDEDKFQGRAQQMKVLERYNQWLPRHRHYLNTLKEHEALEFYMNNFELTQDQKKFIDNI